MFQKNKLLHVFLKMFLKIQIKCTTTFLGMDGQNCTPDGLQFFQRLTRKITAQLLADQNFDIFSLKPELEEKLEQFRNREAIPDFDIGSEEFDIEVPDIVMKTCEEEGCHWIAGTVFRITVLQKRITQILKSKQSDFNNYLSPLFQNSLTTLQLLSLSLRSSQTTVDY